MMLFSVFSGRVARVLMFNLTGGRCAQEMLIPLLVGVFFLQGYH